MSQGNANKEASCIVYDAAEMQGILAGENEIDGTPPRTTLSDDGEEKDLGCTVYEYALTGN